MIGPYVVRRQAARAWGRRAHTGAWFPGVIFDEKADEIDGELLWLDRRTWGEALRRLDAYEGVPVLFRRITISVDLQGKTREAYAYEWGARE